jgi:enoyl-CoA hydratase/carnithine racemase
LGGPPPGGRPPGGAPAGGRPGAGGARAGGRAAGPALANATTKLLLSREQDLDLAGALELEAMAQALLMTGEDHREFYRAFREGGEPTWRGR